MQTIRILAVAALTGAVMAPAASHADDDVGRLVGTIVHGAQLGYPSYRIIRDDDDDDDRGWRGGRAYRDHDHWQTRRFYRDDYDRGRRGSRFHHDDDDDDDGRRYRRGNDDDD